MYLHTMAGICTYSVPAFIALYQGDEHEFAFLAFIKSSVFSCVSQFVLRAQRMFACVSNIESLVCICICRRVSRAHHVSACVSARIKFQACLSMCVCAYCELNKYLRASTAECVCRKCVHLLKAEQVSACVGLHSRLRMIQ
jgi:hypothetical protein